MKQFGLRFLYKHLGQALKELPFEITNHNRVIAVVTPVKNYSPTPTVDDIVDETMKILKEDEQ